MLMSFLPAVISQPGLHYKFCHAPQIKAQGCFSHFNPESIRRFCCPRLNPALTSGIHHLNLEHKSPVWEAGGSTWWGWRKIGASKFSKKCPASENKWIRGKTSIPSELCHRKRPMDIKHPNHSEMNWQVGYDLLWIVFIDTLIFVFQPLRSCWRSCAGSVVCQLSASQQRGKVGWHSQSQGLQSFSGCGTTAASPHCSFGWDLLMEQVNLCIPPQFQSFLSTTSSLCYTSENPAYWGRHQNLHRCQVLHRLHENHLVSQVSPQKIFAKLLEHCSL